MKVLLIHHQWITAINGANTVIKSLLENKHIFKSKDIHLSSLTWESLSNEEYKLPSNSFKSFIRLKAKGYLAILSQYFSWAAKLVVTISEILPAKKIISHCIENKYDIDCDVLLFHSLLPCYEYLQQTSKRKKIVLVMHTNGDTYKMLRIYYKALEKSNFYSKLVDIENYVIQNVDFICFVAESARQNFLERHPYINKEKVKTIYNGITEKKEILHRKLNNPIEICCVASISDRKGQKYIIEALNMFKKENLPNVHFTIIGDGNKRKSLENLVLTNNLTDRISFVGISRDVDKYLSNSDIFILPSEDEGLPMAIIEAMRASLPIISTPVGGIPEMVKANYNGLLIAPDARQLYDLLANINTFDWLKMGRNSRILFEEKFSINSMINSYVKVINMTGV